MPPEGRIGSALTLLRHWRWRLQGRALLCNKASFFTIHLVHNDPLLPCIAVSAAPI